MDSSSTLIFFSVCIVLASLAGGVVPALVRLTHRRLQFGLSFVSGVMLGVALFHMLPHALMARMESTGTESSSHGLFDPLMIAVAAGFMAMFFLQRFAHFHQHELPQPVCHDPKHGHEGHTHHEHDHQEMPVKVGQLTWVGAVLGMGLHSLLEGVALAASIATVQEMDPDAAPVFAGLGTFLVIVLHKPFDAMTVSTLFHASGGSGKRALLLNLLFALLVPVGVGLFMLGISAVGSASTLTPFALAFSAGTFICIAASDLLPEVQFHRHDRLGLSLAFVFGIALALAIGRMEAASHAEHDHGSAPSPAGLIDDGHNHDDHADHSGHQH